MKYTIYCALMISLLIHIVVSPNVKRMNHAGRRAGENDKAVKWLESPFFESRWLSKNAQGTLQGVSPPIEATKK